MLALPINPAFYRHAKFVNILLTPNIRVWKLLGGIYFVYHPMMRPPAPHTASCFYWFCVIVVWRLCVYYVCVYIVKLL